MGSSQVFSQIQGHYYFPKYGKWIFILSFLIISLVYHYPDILVKPPQSLHRWRQCDCLSITLNYYQDHNAFLEPSVHNLGRDGTGKTVSDFPLIYFSIAQLWKIFGYHEYIYRSIILLIFFFGLFVLFKTLENILQDSILAIIAPLFLFTSPTLVYYAINFLMDIPAFALALAGVCFFLKFCFSSKKFHLYLFVLLYLIAGLLKITSLLSFMAIFCIYLLEQFHVSIIPSRKIFKDPLKHFIILTSVVVITVIWYAYASHYNSNHNSGVFLVGILPIWNAGSFEIQSIATAIINHIKTDYFREETQIIFALMWIIILAFYKKTNKTIFNLTLFTFIGFFVYIILFFLALKDHDYYTINLFILCPLIILNFLLLLKENFRTIYTSVIFRIIIVGFLIHNIDFARRRINDRYDPNGWTNKAYIENIQPFRDIPNYLHSIGINKEDRVISLSDSSINITLYMMNMKGWTQFGTSKSEVTTAIRDRIKMKAKYLILYDKSQEKWLNIQPFLANKIGQFKNIEIFKL